MILVIFGPGASYDSCSDFPVKGSNPLAIRQQIPERPPLAVELFYNNEIFARSLLKYWECSPIVPYLREIPDGISFEQRLGQLQDESNTDPIRTKQLTGVRLYLQDMIYQCEQAWVGRTRGVTNYITLMDQLRRASRRFGPITLVTFNYDRLLDESLSHFGVAIRNMDDYIIHNEVKLFKLHGSINWGREIDSLTVADIKRAHPNEISHYVIDESPNFKISNNYVFEDGQSPFVVKNGVPVYPALAIPIETKQTFECPDTHIDKLRQIMKSTERVLIIGWRAVKSTFSISSNQM
jgi:hypothetical protein